MVELNSEIIVEDFIHNNRDTFVYISLENPLVIVGGGGSDGEIISLIAVPFGVNSV